MYKVRNQLMNQLMCGLRLAPCRCNRVRTVWSRGQASLPGRQVLRPRRRRPHHPLDGADRRRLSRQVDPTLGRRQPSCATRASRATRATRLLVRPRRPLHFRLVLSCFLFLFCSSSSCSWSSSSICAAIRDPSTYSPDPILFCFRLSGFVLHIHLWIISVVWCVLFAHSHQHFFSSHPTEEGGGG